ncbi:unnamed protein product [Sphenostylis stenocarpa]|uniref:Cytochrome P450 n=1 Tax=Sphenostylis stenocarpa TaxID=92480 RepID=A0AA86VBK6_9FABA|nr:unnamed protein product [Sphenostylis stenocarpa]
MVSPLLILCLALPLLLLIFFQNRRNLNKWHLPPGPKGLPIIGNLHQLDSSILYLQLWQLSKKYGPLYSLKFGLRRAIVVSSAQLAKEVLKDHDLECCGRPKLLGQQTLFYNGSEVIFSTYGEFWREIRKICIVHVLSYRHVSRFAPIRQHEVKNMMKKISRNASSSKLTNLNEALVAHASSIISRIVFGRSYDDEEAERSRFHGLLNDCQAMMVAFFFYDYIPLLGWIDRLTGQQARLDGIFKEVDKFTQEVIDEHSDPSRKRTTENEDVTDLLLQLQKRRSTSVELTDDVVKAILMV